MKDDILKQHLLIINQIADLEKKLNKLDSPGSTKRNIRRIKSLFEEMNLKVHDLLGESYRETRTDCEATISGNSSENLVIAEIVKPLVTQTINGHPTIVQKAVVIVEELNH